MEGIEGYIVLLLYFMGGGKGGALGLTMKK